MVFKPSRVYRKLFLFVSASIFSVVFYSPNLWSRIMVSPSKKIMVMWMYEYIITIKNMSLLLVLVVCSSSHVPLPGSGMYGSVQVLHRSIHHFSQLHGAYVRQSSRWLIHLLHCYMAHAWGKSSIYPRVRARLTLRRLLHDVRPWSRKVRALLHDKVHH
jgi:hypothetical protein